MIDWDLAISTGTRWARPGPQVSLAEARRTVSELRDLAGAVQQPVYEVTGMSAARDGSIGRVAVVDRPGWIRANVDGFRVVLEPLVEQLRQRAPGGHGYVLACPPEVEGSIYEASGLDDANLYGRLESIGVPVTVVRSSVSVAREPAIDMAASPTAPDLASQFRRGRDVQVPHSHFIPMEAPGLVAELITQGNENGASVP